MSDDLEKIISAAGGRIGRPLSEGRLAEVMEQIRASDLYGEFKMRGHKDSPDHVPDEEDLALFDRLREICRTILVNEEESSLVFLQILTALRKECQAPWPNGGIENV